MKVATNNPPEGYPRLSPYIYYENTGSMTHWLSKAFGFEVREQMADQNGSVLHAEMTFAECVIMMGSPGEDYKNPSRLGQTTQSLYIYVDDVDSHCEAAIAAGAEIVEKPADQDYGDRRYAVRDPEGHVWYFATRT